jgi:peptide/nickel transport system ATP-binding protein
MLELKAVGKVYGGGLFGARANAALRDVSLTFSANRPRIVAVVGESGSGKTTLAQILLGFLSPSSGEVLYEGKDVARLDPTGQRAFRRSVQAVLQDPFSAFNPFYKVDHALTVPLRSFGLGTSDAERRQMMRDACEQVGLNPDDTLGRFPHQLSGGQRQRLMVARALMLSPRLIVADEPVSMVDASLRATILGNVAALRNNHGISVVYITHDLTTAYHIADSVLVLYRGHVVEAGDVEAVLKSPQHPYTQLLIDSVPWPDLTRKWGQLPLTSGQRAIGEGPGGCPFRGRCPEAIPRCAEAMPPWLVTGPAHVAACWRRGDTRTRDAAGIARMLAGETA